MVWKPENSQGTSKAGGFAFASTSSSSLSYLSEIPSFTAISDAHLVVAFKNLLKKDTNTKTKALGDILSFANAHPHEGGGVEDAVVEAWVALYPRMSIDNDRRVRELSHTVQLALLRSARKRMERHVPTVVGPWLAGLYDRDTAVSRAANDGLSTFLTTPEKWDQFWKRCRDRLLEYAEGALAETPDTLSDERTTSKEDAERKLARVRAGTLDLICGMIEHAPAGLEKEERFAAVMESGQTWVGISDADVGMRRAVCQLVTSCTDGDVDYLGSHLTQIKGKFVLDGLKQQHAGSAAVFVSALQSLAAKHPEIWTPSKGKEAKLAKSIFSFVENGSRSGPAYFWEYLAELVTGIALLSDGENSSKLLAAMRRGLARRDEPRQNVFLAWMAYLKVAEHFVASTESPDAKAELLRDNVFPMFDACIFPHREEWLPWKITMQPYKVLAKAYSLASDATSFAVHLDDLSTQTCQLVSASLPEVSAEYASSQQKVADVGGRWLEVAAVARSADDAKVAKVFATPIESIVARCADVLRRRDFKPWGASSVLASATASRTGLGLSTVSAFLESITEPELSVAITSPSAPHLLRCLKVLSSDASQSPLHQSLWLAWTCIIINLPESQDRKSALDSLFASPPDPASVHENTLIQDFLFSSICTSLAEGQSTECTIGEGCIQTGILSKDRMDGLVKACISAVEKGHSDSGISLLHAIAVHSPKSLAPGPEEQTSFLMLLLRIDQDSKTSNRIAAIRDALGGTVADGRPVLAIIKSNLEMVGPDSLNVDMVYNLATDMLKGSETAAEDVVPSTSRWMEAIEAVLGRGVDLGAAVGSPIESVYPLIESPNPPSTAIAMDRSGASVAARIGAYMTRLLSSSKLDMASLSQSLQVEVMYLLLLTRAMATAQRVVHGSDGLWKSLSTQEERRRADILILAIGQVVDKVVKSGSAQRPVVEALQSRCLDKARKLTPIGLFSAEILAHIAGLSTGTEEKDAALDIWKATPSTILPACSMISAHVGKYSEKPPKFLTNLTNKLISDAAVAKADENNSTLSLVLLNTCLDVFSGAKLPVANNRVVFAVRQLTSWIGDADSVGSIGPHLATELCKALTHLFPEVKDVYGPYWQRAVDLCFVIWGKAKKAPLEQVAASARAAMVLYIELTRLEDSNDDLFDALSDSNMKHAAALVALLKSPRNTPESPLVSRLDSLVCQEIRKLPVDDFADPSAFFGLLASDAKDVQTAAFSVLGKGLPEAQQQVAIDAALDKTEVLLPDELVSLLFDAPTLEKYPDEQVLASFPAPIRSYLLAWLLVFDTIESAPHRIRPDYIDHLRREQRLEGLLTFAADVLGHTAIPPNPINLDQRDITPEMRKEYSILAAEDLDAELCMDWLLVHLVFRTIRLLPNMFRAWLFNTVKPGTKHAMSGWVSRFLTPLLIDTLLEDVVVWAETAKPSSDDESPLVIKTNRAGSVVTAGYEVDGQLASIGIQFPPTYPMDLVDVQMRNQVVGSEKQWATWLKVTEGLIATSNGNVIDGLLAFKRNISGALHGQDECAICYAIVASDKRLPDMRCGTCKHMFHRVCLYKWFQTSNQNTCPLCRTEMNWHATRPERGGPGGRRERP